MTPATVAYLLRLAWWGLAAALPAGAVVWSSWLLACRSLPPDPVARHRTAWAHLLALVAIPLLLVASMHLGLTSMGEEITRPPPPVGSAPFLSRTAGVTGLGVAIWSVGLLVSLARLAEDFAALRALGGSPADARLRAEVDHLAARVGAESRLDLLIAPVTSPLVLGAVRVHLLLPPRFAGFRAAEREALLLHELAHVVRRDFLWNVVGRLVVAILWFQPAAWALHRSMAREREAACDAWAVARGAAPAALAGGLVRLAELERPPRLAQAAGAGADLARRIELLLAPRSHRRLRAATVLIASSTLAVVALPLVAGEVLARADPNATDLYIASAFGPVVAIAAVDPAGRFGMKVRQGRVLAASIGSSALGVRRIRQAGDRVILLGADGRAALTVRLTTAGRITWRAREASPGRVRGPPAD